MGSGRTGIGGAAVSGGAPTVTLPGVATGILWVAIGIILSLPKGVREVKFVGLSGELIVFSDTSST